MSQPIHLACPHGHQQLLLQQVQQPPDWSFCFHCRLQTLSVDSSNSLWLFKRKQQKNQADYFTSCLQPSVTLPPPPGSGISIYHEIRIKPPSHHSLQDLPFPLAQDDLSSPMALLSSKDQDPSNRGPLQVRLSLPGTSLPLGKLSLNLRIEEALFP